MLIPMKIVKFNIFTLNSDSHIHGCIISGGLEVIHDLIVMLSALSRSDVTVMLVLVMGEWSDAVQLCHRLSIER